jgi:hypothetical protein
MGQLAAMEAQANAAQLVALGPPAPDHDGDDIYGDNGGRSFEGDGGLSAPRQADAVLSPALSPELRRKALALCKAAHKRLSLYCSRLDLADATAAVRDGAGGSSSDGLRPLGSGGQGAAQLRRASSLMSDSEGDSDGQGAAALARQGGTGGRGGGIGFDSDDDDGGGGNGKKPPAKRPRASDAGGDWSEAKGSSATARPLSSQAPRKYTRLFTAGRRARGLGQTETSLLPHPTRCSSITLWGFLFCSRLPSGFQTLPCAPSTSARSF